MNVTCNIPEHVWEGTWTLLWGDRTDRTVELRALATCSTFCFLLWKSNLILSWQCFQTCSVDDGTAIPSRSSTALRFWFLSFILVLTFFWLDSFNHDAAFLSGSVSPFFLSSSSEMGLFVAFSWMNSGPKKWILDELFRILCGRCQPTQL